MHQIKLPARLTDQSIASFPLASLKLGQRAMDAHHKHVTFCKRRLPILAKHRFEDDFIQNEARRSHGERCCHPGMRL